MKKMLSMVLTLVLMFVLSSVAVNAADQCDVVGQSYTVYVGDEPWTLTNFENAPMFSPAPECGGSVILVDPDGAGWSYGWSITDNGLIIAGTPAELTDDGLIVYFIPQGLHTLQVGNMVYKTEQEIPTLLFK